jgi:hypothetical protein
MLKRRLQGSFRTATRRSGTRSSPGEVSGGNLEILQLLIPTILRKMSPVPCHRAAVER